MTEDVDPASRPGQAGDLLESWKEIAAYLNRDVSTVKRWERREGLPIRRQMHRLRGSVYALRSEIDTWRSGRQPVTDGAPPARLWGRLPRLLGYGALVAAALISSGDRYLVAAGKRAPGTPGSPIERRLLSQRDMDLNNFFFLKPSPDGRQVAYSAIGTEEGALFVRDLDSGRTRKLTTGEFTTSPVWSSDGLRLAYAATSTATPALKVIDLKTGASTVLVAIDGTMVAPLDWSSDRTRLLCSLTRPDRTSSLVLMPLAKGGLVTLISQGWNASSTASFSPDGRFIAFSAQENGQRDIYVLTADGTQKNRITQEAGPSTSPLWSPTGDSLLYQRDDGVWAIRVSEGRPQGSPRLIRATPFDQPIAWTAAGVFYVMYNYVSAPYALSTEPPAGSDQDVAQRLDVGVDQVDRFAWSPDMNGLVISRLGDGKIYLSSRRDHGLRSFPTSFERSPSSLWWSADGQSILFVPYQVSKVLSIRVTDGAIREIVAHIADAERFDITRDETHMLFFKGSRTTGRRQLLISKLGEPDGLVIASEPDKAGAFSTWVRPLFSRDGAHVLFGRASTAEDSLWTVNADGSGLRRLASVPHGSSGGPGPGRVLHYAAWSPDGHHIAYDDRRSLFIVDVQTGENHLAPLPAAFAEIGVTSWSPDGRQIGLRAQAFNYELWVSDGALVTPPGAQ